MARIMRDTKTIIALGNHSASISQGLLVNSVILSLQLGINLQALQRNDVQRSTSVDRSSGKHK